MNLKLTISTILCIALFATGTFLVHKFNTQKQTIEELSCLIDSVKTINALPPDTTWLRDTIVKVDTISIHRQFEKINSTDSVKHYKDSLVNNDIRVWIDLYATKLFDIDWRYQPIIHKEIQKIEIPYPKIITQPVYQEKKNRGIYGFGGIDFQTGFSGRCGIGYMPNNKILYGINIGKQDRNSTFGVFVAYRLFGTKK